MYEIQARTLETMTSEQRELVLKMAERDRDAAAEELKRMQDNLYKLVELYTVWRSARQEFREGQEQGLFDYEERLERSSNLSRLSVELRSLARNIDPKLWIIDTPFWELQPIEYFDEIFGGLINRLIEESSIAAGELNKLIEQVDRLNSAVKAFAGATSEVDAEKAIAEFGRYAYELNKRFFSENSLYDKTIADIKSRMDSVNRTIEDMTKGMLDASNTFEKYFDLTGQGLHLYATEYARIVKLQNNLAKARMDASRSLLDEETRVNLGVGSLSETSYFIILDKAVQAHEELDSAINKNRDTLKKAYAAGIIGVQDYLVALARLDKDQSWDNHRKKIADMLDNLKSGTENAIKNAIKGFLSGADDAAEKFKEALSEVRTDALAEGISSWIQSSDYFQIQMARQQQALAAVFGADGTRDPVEIADKQLGFLKDIKEDGETLVSVAQEIATNVANLPGDMSVVSSSLVEDALGRSRGGRAAARKRSPSSYF